MRCFVVVPGALVPQPLAADLLAAAQAPALLHALERAQVVSTETLEAPAHLHWLWRAFGGTGTVVTAPYAWRALSEAASFGPETELPLWSCDPVHVAFARDHLLVTPLDDAPPSPEEARQLATEAAEAARELGAQLRVLNGHWFLCFDPPVQLQATPLDDALGRSMQERLPGGDDAVRWRKLLTEIQIRWHHHPVNAAREARGMKAINGLWLHGGGVASALPAAPFNAVFSDDPVLRGWALAAGLPPVALHGESQAPSRTDSLLTVRRALLAPARLEQWHAWLEAFAQLDRALSAWLSQAWAAGAASVDLVLCGERLVRTLRLTRHDGWRLWRRHRMADLFAEPVA